VYTRSEIDNLLLRYIFLRYHQCVGQRTLQPEHHEHRPKGRVPVVPANKRKLAHALSSLEFVLRDLQASRSITVVLKLCAGEPQDSAGDIKGFHRHIFYIMKLVNLF
jgi:hypothetical protein